MELKPAHVVIVEMIEVHCRNVSFLESPGTAAEILLRHGPSIAAEIPMNRAQEIGGLCALCHVLGQMIIPEEDLKRIADKLIELDQSVYRHAVLYTTYETLLRLRHDRITPVACS